MGGFGACCRGMGIVCLNGRKLKQRGMDNKLWGWVRVLSGISDWGGGVVCARVRVCEYVCAHVQVFPRARGHKHIHTTAQLHQQAQSPQQRWKGPEHGQQCLWAVCEVHGVRRVAQPEVVALQGPSWSSRPAANATLDRPSTSPPPFVRPSSTVITQQPPATASAQLWTFKQGGGGALAQPREKKSAKMRNIWEKKHTNHEKAKKNVKKMHVKKDMQKWHRICNNWEEL